MGPYYIPQVFRHGAIEITYPKHYFGDTPPPVKDFLDEKPP